MGYRCPPPPFYHQGGKMNRDSLGPQKLEFFCLLLWSTKDFKVYFWDTLVVVHRMTIPCIYIK